jgi:hypothetical protein
LGITRRRQTNTEHYIAQMGYGKGQETMVRTKHYIEVDKVKTAKVTLVHSFNMGDSEDPYLMAVFPLSDWEKTEQGQYVLEHAVEKPTFFCDVDHERLGYRVNIYAYLKEEDLTFYFLKFPQKK